MRERADEDYKGEGITAFFGGAGGDYMHPWEGKGNTRGRYTGTQAGVSEG